MKRSSTLLLTLSLLGFAPACGKGGGGDQGVSGSSGGSGGSASGGLTGGASAGGGHPSGGAPGAGGSASGASGAGGSAGSGAQPSGGAGSTGGRESGGAASGSASAGGGLGSDGGSGSGGGNATVGDCAFSVMTNEVSPKMATVGVVEWSVDGVMTEAKVVYALQGAPSDVLNLGGEAPVDLAQENYRTLLLGLKQESNYTFTIDAIVDGERCVSAAYSLPTTGTLDGAPPFSVNVASPKGRESGFIVATAGYTGDSENDSWAFILDADGDTVWAAAAPPDAPRAKMDYEGKNMWMMALNFGGGVGEMRLLSMDGQASLKDVAGLDRAHHDFTVMPGGKVATMAWTAFEIEPESDLLVRSPDGTVETPFRIGANLYVAPEDRYHCNALHYIEEDDTFTISDRNPSLLVNVSSSGELNWQLGGSCAGAPAGPEKCSAQDWQLNHGHHLLPDGSLVVFANGTRGGDHSYVVELDISATESSMSATVVKDYEGTASSGILGDVQRLPGGNTLITYSDDGQIVEVDASWQVVQTFTGSVGYSDWRPTLYGRPARL